MFDMAIRKPEVLYSKAVEVSERVVLEQCTESGRLKQALTSPMPLSTSIGITGEVVHILKQLGNRSLFGRNVNWLTFPRCPTSPARCPRPF